MTHCPRCGDPNLVEEEIDAATKIIRCALGHSLYLFKFRETWETGPQRMKRLERHFICSACKTNCVTYKDNYEGNERTICDLCAAREYKQMYVPLGKRKNLGSPWRLWAQHEKGEAKRPVRLF